MRTNIRKWGNSLALRIPKSFASEASLSENTPVEVVVVDGKLVVSPVIRKKWSLDELLEGVTDENRHGEVYTGPPVGKEIW